MEYSKLQEIFPSKLTEFTQENYVLDGTASKRDVFLSRDTCDSSSKLYRPLWNKMSLF
jgi:hypothetical protein